MAKTARLYVVFKGVSGLHPSQRGANKLLKIFVVRA